MTKYKEVEIDLEDFDNDEIISYLEGVSDFTEEEVKRLKGVIDEQMLSENVLYQEIIKYTSLDDQMKLELIFSNLHKVSYNEIYNLFKP